MITRLIVDGLLKLVSVRKDEHSSKRIARVYDPACQIPEGVIVEKENNIFYDEVNNRIFKLTKLGFQAI